jgi:dihydrofolate synthase/folylpolyglutamate synthase
MAKAMDLLGNPEQDLRVIHITGTSGKTSTCYYIRALLEASGFRTGLTVSPHIVTLNERVQVGGLPLEEERLCRYADQMLSLLEPLRGHLTYFELMICLAIWVFAQERVDYAVVEVGIGGTRDATNILNRSDKVAVIGPIGLDHTEKLGGTIAEIAAQKAGIIVEGGVVFVVDQSLEVLEVIKSKTDEINARMVVVPGSCVPLPSSCIPPLSSCAQSQDPQTHHTSEICAEDETMYSQAPSLDSESRHTLDLCAGQSTLRIQIPQYQLRNWDLALAAVSHIAQRDKFTIPTHHDELMHVVPPARFEWIQTGHHRVLLDGAHNPQKVASLVETIQAQGLGPFPTLATLTKAPETKILETLAALAPVVSHLIVPQFQLGKDDKIKASVPPTQVAAIAQDLGIPVRIIHDLDQALRVLLDDLAEEVLVTGSLYMAALVRPLLVG